MKSADISLTFLRDALVERALRLLYTLDFALLLIACSLILSIRRKIIENASSDFKNKEGRKMVILKQNTRVSRFTNGLEISHEGRRLAGADPYLVKNGAKLEVVIHSPEHARDFYAKDAKYHTKPPNANFGEYFGRLLGKCVGMLNGTTWDKAKQHIAPQFSHRAAMENIPVLKAEYIRWIEHLSEDRMISYKNSDGSGFTIDAVAACRKLPFKLVAMILYGDMLTDERFNELWELNAVHEKVTHVALLEDLPAKWWYSFLPTKYNKLLQEYQEAWERLNLVIISEAREKRTPCALSEMYKGVEKGDMTLYQFLQSLDEILFTNVDVTSTIFASVLIDLARNQEFQLALRREILFSSHNPDSYYTNDNNLLHFCYLEALRIHPIIWFSIPETTGPDYKYIGSFLIPPYTPVIIDLNAINTQSPVWGSDGHVFRPSRWCDLSPSAVRYSLQTYGMGPRKCTGRNLANISIKMLMVTVLGKYELHTKTGDKEKSIKLRTDRFTCTPDQEVEFRRLSGGE